MRILLIQPPVEDFYITSQRLQPTGLLYLASFLNVHGHQADILDCLRPFSETAIEIDEDLVYLKDFYKPDLMPARIFNSYKHFGLDEKGLKDKLSGLEYDAYGITCNFCAYEKQALMTAKVVRETHPDATIICGGNAVPILYDNFLKSWFFDIAVFGEGETSLLQLLENGLNPETVPNIMAKSNGGWIRNPTDKNFNINSSELNLAAIDPENYKIGKRRSLSVVSSRGCPYQCAYCTANINCGNGYMRMGLEKFCAMIDENVKQYDITALNVEDENFTYERDYAIRFLEWKIRNHFHLRLYFMNGLAWQDLDEELLHLLKKADLHNLNLSLVERNASRLGRKSDEAGFLKILKTAQNLGFAVTVYLIAGMPGQTKDNLRDSIDWLHSLGVVIGYSVYYPVPGTRLFKLNRTLFKDLLPVQMRSTALAVAQENLTRKDLTDLFRYVRLLNGSLELKGKPSSHVDLKPDPGMLEVSEKLPGEELTRLGVDYFHNNSAFLLLKKITHEKGKYRYQFEKLEQNIV